MVPLDRGAAIPENVRDFSGLCFMGGPMSVNDDLPWIEPVCALIRAAAAAEIPVLGHCLGGQLMSKALGGRVTKNPMPEIGWSTATGATDAIARHWLGDFAGRELTIFHWHSETFSLPEQASLLLHGAACAHQAFVLGPHLGMQGHVEMLPEMIECWYTQWQDEVAAVAHLATVQEADAMRADIPKKLPELRRIADQLYGVWIQGLRG